MRSFAAPGVRLIQLHIFLATSQKAHSLHRLSTVFKCSRQTILRSLEQLESANLLHVESWREGRQKLVRGKAVKGDQDFDINPNGLRHLLLCRDLVQHLMPSSLREELKSADRAASSLFGDAPTKSSHGESFGKGLIDYGPFRGHIDTIQQAMQSGTLCKLHYAARHSATPKAYVAAPLSILAYREALYFRCAVCSARGTHIEDVPRTFAIQRIRRIELLDRPAPALPDFPKLENFGFPIHEPMKVRVTFTPEAADYVRERRWSADQRIRNRKGGGILLTFTSTSRREILSWVLSFGDDAELIEPKGLREELKLTTSRMNQRYRDTRK